MAAGRDDPLRTTDVWDATDPIPKVLRALAAGRTWNECPACGDRVYLEARLVDDAVGRLIDDNVLTVEPLFRGGAISRAAIAGAATVWLTTYDRERAH